MGQACFLTTKHTKHTKHTKAKGQRARSFPGFSV